MFVENIFTKVNALLTACSLRTRRPRGVPSPDKGRSPSCATEASGNRGLKHTGSGGGEDPPGNSGDFVSRKLHTNLPALAGPQASRSRVPSAPTPSAKPPLPQTAKEAEILSFFNQRKKQGWMCACAEKGPKSRSQSAVR